jgi:hypothetical protein
MGRNDLGVEGRVMDEAWRERVRERAYAIWLREGSPDGRAEQFWLMAEEELLAEGQGRSGGHPERATDEGQADQAIKDALPANDEEPGQARPGL